MKVYLVMEDRYTPEVRAVYATESQAYGSLSIEERAAIVHLQLWVETSPEKRVPTVPSLPEVWVEAHEVLGL